MNPKKILIAEDEKPMANALGLKLRSAGYETTLVYDGEAAISSVQSAPFDLIILDLVMPKKDGFFVLAELKKLKIATPVIVSSNLSQEEDIKRAKELGARDYFIKSDTTLAEIVAKVKQWILQ
ncbi:response regulator [Candidatus Collierbacteria bacterium]|nr:response regulator [Candidatus Collierbacteria bacterium]